MMCAPLMIILLDGVSVWHPTDRTLIRGREQSPVSLHMAGESRPKVKMTKCRAHNHKSCFIGSVNLKSVDLVFLYIVSPWENGVERVPFMLELNGRAYIVSF